MKNKFVHWLVEVNDSEIRSRSTFWNLISSLINASYSAILMFFIGRIIGLEEVGIFSLATAYAYQCLSIGVFGVRNIQASDVKIDHTFSDYFYLRIGSSIAMYLLLLFYTFQSAFNYEKMAIIFLFGFFKSIEAIEDLYHGEYHRHDRLDIGCILQATRYIISLIFFVILIYVTGNLILSFFLSTVLTTILCYFQNKYVISYFVKEKLKFSMISVSKLFVICLPLCISNAINMYIVNSPKYAIEGIGDTLMQADYGILFLPVMTINLLSAIIYRPYINTLSKKYYQAEYRDFFILILKQLAVIIMVTFVIMLGGYIIGLHLLEIIYKVDLMNHMSSFIVMLLSGGVNTIAIFLTIIVTIQRAQNYLLFSYLITGLISLLISNWLVSTYAILGAALVYLFLSVCMVILFSVIILLAFKKEKKNRM